MKIKLFSTFILLFSILGGNITIAQSIEATNATLESQSISLNISPKLPNDANEKYGITGRITISGTSYYISGDIFKTKAGTLKISAKLFSDNERKLYHSSFIASSNTVDSNKLFTGTYEKANTDAENETIGAQQSIRFNLELN